MPERFPASLQQKIEDRLRYYEDLGIRLFYTDRGRGRRNSRGSRTDCFRIFARTRYRGDRIAKAHAKVRARRKLRR